MAGHLLDKTDVRYVFEHQRGHDVPEERARASLAGLGILGERLIGTHPYKAAQMIEAQRVPGILQITDTRRVLPASEMHG